MPVHANSSTAIVDSFKTFSELLKYLRRRARLTQNQLAGAVGYSREHLARLETGARPPDVAVVMAQFIPVLGLQSEPDTVKHLIELAQASHGTHVDVHSLPIAAPNELHPLPIPLTTFVGREHVAAEIMQLVGHARLVTLTGSGGVGKTRLALYIAENMRQQFADAVSFVELAPVQDMAFVASAVVAALKLSAFRPPLETLTTHLSEQHRLLILDNCEHVLLSCAELADQLLRTCPKLHILATSRESFSMLGATVYRVPSLSLPSSAQLQTTVADGLKSESVQLFVDRVRALKPGFALTERTAPIIAHICQRLDGVPLAIELAASLARAMSVEQIAARLEDRFNLLTTGNITALPRHQTLRAAIDWSHALLSDDEKRLFRRLAVFVGSWTLGDVLHLQMPAEAAGVYPINDPPQFDIAQSLAVLTALVDKSLIMVDENDDETHYHMLESIRDYALNKLHEAGETAQTRLAHVHLYTRLAEQADPQLRLADQRQWYKRLETAHDNIRAALNWVSGMRDAAMTLRLVAALWFFWFWRGYWIEGLTRTQNALALPHDAESMAAIKVTLALLMFASRSGNNSVFNEVLPRVRAMMHNITDPYVLAWANIALSFANTDHDQAAQLLEAAAEQAKMVDDGWVLAEALFIHGDRERARGQTNRATALYQHSIAILRSIHDHSLIAYPIGNLGRVAMDCGNDTQAVVHYEEAVALCREDGNNLGVADWLLQLGTLAVRRHETERASHTLAESIQRFYQIGNFEGVADALVQYATLARNSNQLSRSATLLGAADRILETHNRLHQLVEMTGSAEFNQRIAEIRPMLNDSNISSAWVLGRAMTMAQVLAFALERHY